jgi:choline dehydrogenase-like flavoprotein
MEPFDAIVIGSGFGGAVAACRLTQAGQRVCLLERGRRFKSKPVSPGKEPHSDFPKLPASDRVLPDMARLIWGDDRGLWQMRDLGKVKAFVAAGYGGGSLIYANVHLRPPEEAFETWPEGTRGSDLEEYYRLAAYMLDVRPITEAPFHPLPKTDQFAKAADALGRGDEFFYPPLALRLNGDGKNAFGKRQSPCRACGECLTGCRYRAKNSLDLNYLAVAERQTNEDGVRLLSVRTGAEALRIKALEAAGPGGPRYEVEYRDYVEGRGITSVCSRSVFVCAGALGSTELLLRSAKHGGLPKLAGLEALGRGFLPNADALGVVFDARLGSDSNGTGGSRRELYPTVGPTITASLVYDTRAPHDRHSAGAHPWFLLQDGGFPLAVRRHMGLMRAPVLLRRNRFAPGRDAGGRFGVPAAAASDAREASALYGSIDQRLHAEASSPLDARPFYSLPDALVHILKDDRLSKYLPEGLKTAVRQLRSDVTTRADRDLVPIVAEVENELADELARRLAKVLLLGHEGAWLSGPLARMGRAIIRCLLPYEDVATCSRKALEKYYLSNGLRFATQAATELCAFEDPDDIHSKHSMVLLAMGIDGFRSSLILDESDELRSDLDVPVGAPVYRTQEQLMHDVATALRGDLRVSPLWAFARAPVTVHSQGGCAMGRAEDGSVTNPYGEVHCYDDLYVLDAAVFPGSVGANPSATILALAERNIEHFIQEHIAKDWMAPERKDNKVSEFWSEWGPKLDNPKQRTFIRPPEVKSRPPVAEPIGMTFTEAMYGYHSELAKVPAQESDYDAADMAGREKGQSFKLTLTATAPDASELAADTKHHRMSICGTLTLTWPAAGMVKAVEVPVSGHLDVFTSDRRMLYQLWGRVSDSGPPIKLNGCKVLRADPGPDAIRDTTTLYTSVQLGERVSYGVMHVALDELLRCQLPSFTVTGTDDPARIVWALGSFGAFFFGALQKVYLPGLDKVIDLSQELGIR